jgi:DNA-binding CsgD family transcriptional regulator
MTRAADRRRYHADTAARLRAAGWSLRQIARYLGVSPSTVRADLSTAPVPLQPDPRPRPFDRDWRPDAERLRAAGHPDHRNSQPMPFYMIASRLAVDERDVRRYFARLRRLDTRAANAASLRAGGLSLRAIAACLGVSEATVRRDLAATPVRHPAARKKDVRPGSGAGTAHPHDAGGNVIPLRRTS